MVRKEIKRMAIIQNFRFWCQKVLPLVYDDSLSYYELLCKVVEYLNNTIQAVNENTEDVAQMRLDINAFKTAINAKVLELETYMRDYFSNLDVQEEINNKLDTMAADGTLTTIIAPFVRDLTVEFDDRINEAQETADLANTRISNIIDLPQGSTTLDAEVADIRVGANGITYASAGDAVRGQVSDLSSSLLLDRHKATRLEAETDFDDITTVGNYYVGTTSDAQSMVNIPIQSAGRLTVMTLLNGVVLQTYDSRVSHTSRRFWRLMNDDNIFGDWSEIASIEKVKKTFVLDRADASRLEEGTDFDSLTTIGNFYVGSAAEAQTMTNMPIQSAGRLTVMTLLSGVIMQMYDARKAGNIKRYWRLKDDVNPWSVWWETASVDEIPAMAFVLDRANASRLASGTDLDTLTTVGNYYVGTSTEANSMPNIPTGYAGRLTVTTLLNRVYMQTYDAREGSTVRRFWRVKDDANPWGAWKEMAFRNKYTEILSYESGETYPYAQGFCMTDRYIYMCNIYDNSAEVIYKYDKFTFERLDSIEFTGLIQHGNDFAWVPSTKRIYCANGGGSDTVTVFDEDFNYIESITVDQDIVSLSGLAYDPVSGLWCVSGGNNLKLYVLENLTDTTPVATIEYEATTEFQGLAFNNFVIYGINSSGYITLFNIAGDIVESTRVGKAYGEFENIKIAGGKIFYNVQNHTDQIGALYCSPIEDIVSCPTVM